MPYIAINTSLELSDSKKEKIKAELGRIMSIIPTKTEAGLFVDFSDGRTQYKGGIKIDGAFIDLRLFHKSEFEPKKQYASELFNILIQELGLKKEHIYMNISEFENWGSNGEFR